VDSFTRPVEGDAETRLEELYAQALRLPPGERGAFLEAGCGGDGRLHDEVMDLLEAHERAGSFLGAGERMAEVVEEELARLRPESAGDRLGPYRLLERIGEGGFGLVWVAEQEVPIRRRVALKILKPGLDTREVMARFEQERHALALMDHPNIAKVLDAGATELGRPYFVMEPGGDGAR
jgi:serine/threonine protein kinase